MIVRGKRFNLAVLLGCLGALVAVDISIHHDDLWWLLRLPLHLVSAVAVSRIVTYRPDDPKPAEPRAPREYRQ